MSEIQSIGMWGGNTYQSFILKPVTAPTGFDFYLEEYDSSTVWRYRSRIEIIKAGDPDYLDLEFWYVQFRRYEDGTEKNKIAFGLRDMDGNYVVTDPLTSIKLYDKDGIQVPLSDRKFYSLSKFLNGRYDAAQGRWSFDSAFVNDSGYGPEFSVPFKVDGNYHLEVSDGARTYHGFQHFAGKEMLPIIPSTSFRAIKNSEGSLILTWDVPSQLEFINSGLQTSVRAWIDVYQGSAVAAELWLNNLPTHLGYAIIPQTVMQMLEAEGDSPTFQLQLRTIDNFNRTYSNAVPLSQLKKPGGAVVIPLN